MTESERRGHDREVARLLADFKSSTYVLYQSACRRLWALVEAGRPASDPEVVAGVELVERLQPAVVAALSTLASPEDLAEIRAGEREAGEIAAALVVGAIAGPVARPGVN